MSELEPNKSQLNAVHDVLYFPQFTGHVLFSLPGVTSQLHHYVLCCSTSKICSTLSQIELHQYTLKLVLLFSSFTFQFPPFKGDFQYAFNKTLCL